jgi:U3 small nucleolar ribonucleoprotein component
MPTIRIEEVAPVTMSEANMMAPEEIHVMRETNESFYKIDIFGVFFYRIRLKHSQRAQLKKTRKIKRRSSRRRNLWSKRTRSAKKSCFSLNRLSIQVISDLSFENSFKNWNLFFL